MVNLAADNNGEPDPEHYRMRLRAAIALKDFAIAHKLSPDPHVCEQLNELYTHIADSVTLEQRNLLDKAIVVITKKTYPTSIDTVGISPDPSVRTWYRYYQITLASIGVLMTLLAVTLYYSSRVAAFGGDIEIRLDHAKLLAEDLDSKRKETRIARLAHSAAVRELESAKLHLRQGLEESPPTDSAAAADVANARGVIVQLENASLQLKDVLDTAIADEELALQVVKQANSELAWAEVWPACLAATLGTLGAATYLLYRLIGAYAQVNATINSLYSELLRLPIGAIVGWIVFVAFCQHVFRQSFLTKTNELDFASQSLLLLPFIAGYSSKLVVELLNRVIDGVRTAIGLKPTESADA